MKAIDERCGFRPAARAYNYRYLRGRRETFNIGNRERARAGGAFRACRARATKREVEQWAYSTFCTQSRRL